MLVPMNSENKAKLSGISFTNISDDDVTPHICGNGTVRLNGSVWLVLNSIYFGN